MLAVPIKAECLVPKVRVSPSDFLDYESCFLQHPETRQIEIINEDDLVLVISQSGETADTLAALELAKEKGALTYGIVNVVGSTIARSTHAGSYIHAGPEIGVASTKAFTTQLTALALLTISLARRNGLSEAQEKLLVDQLNDLPALIGEVLTLDPEIEALADYHRADASYQTALGRSPSTGS